MYDVNASSRDAWFVEVARMLLSRLNPEKYAAPEHATKKGALKTNAVVLLCTQVYLIRSMLDIAMELCEERASLANELAEGGGEGERDAVPPAARQAQLRVDEAAADVGAPVTACVMPPCVSSPASENDFF